MNDQILDTPIGALRLVSDGARLVKVEFAGHYPVPVREADSGTEDSLLARAINQFGEYFAGRRKRFDLPLAPAGTPFQRTVWAALADIPWGEVRSYRDIAIAIGRPTAVRAVGAANGRNPLPLVVPCHRVVGSDGSLTGFAGGLAIKRRLLELEGALPIGRSDFRH
jgi:methylated-DNA-[protein]-cysteine S-methyltransferase